MNELLDRLTQALNLLAEKLEKLWDEIVKALENNLRKHYTLYKLKMKIRLFDKRKRVHYCRNNC